MRINGAETANLNGKSEAQRQIAHRGHRSYCSAAQSYAVMLATRRSTTPATPAHIMQTAHHSDKQNVECNMQCCDCFMLLHLRPTARTCADCGATALTGSSACSRRTL